MDAKFTEDYVRGKVKAQPTLEKAPNKLIWQHWVTTK